MLRWTAAWFWIIVPCAAAQALDNAPKQPGELPAIRIDPEMDRRGRELVAQLGAESYLERAQAREQLMNLGRPAVDPLEAGVQSEDPEIRLRCTELLIALRGRGFLGITLEELPADETAEEDGVPPDGTQHIPPPFVQARSVIGFKELASYGVRRALPAETSGLQSGDKLLAVNGRSVCGNKDLMREVTVVGPGRVASLLVERGTARLRIPVLLTRNPMRTIMNQDAGIYSQSRDSAPPVDLEKELNLPEEDPEASLHKDRKGALDNGVEIELPNIDD